MNPSKALSIKKLEVQLRVYSKNKYKTHIAKSLLFANCDFSNTPLPSTNFKLISYQSLLLLLGFTQILVGFFLKNTITDNPLLLIILALLSFQLICLLSSIFFHDTTNQIK
jgi:hypothetical protein